MDRADETSPAFQAGSISLFGKSGDPPQLRGGDPRSCGGSPPRRRVQTAAGPRPRQTFALGRTRDPNRVLAWGKKWGKVPHRSQPISAALDFAKTTLDRAPRSPAELPSRSTKPKVTGSNPVWRIVRKGWSQPRSPRKWSQDSGVTSAFGPIRLRRHGRGGAEEARQPEPGAGRARRHG